MTTFAAASCGDKGKFSFAQLQSCTTILQQETGQIRILFMVDNSGSTQQTDPDHRYRASTIRTFLSQFGSKANFSYSFGYFLGTSTRGYNGTSFVPSPSPGFGDSTFLGHALDKYVTLLPAGNTPYVAAFNSLKALVTADVAANAGKYTYAVVFMSDGMPTDLSPGATSVETDLKGLVDGLKGAVPGSSLTVSSVYFGPADQADAIENLRVIARQGVGQFVDTNQVGDLAISDLITLPGKNCAGQTGAPAGT